MGDLAFRRVGIDCVVDRNARAVRRGERASVARLAAGIGVEHRAVEHDAALLGDREHARLAFLQIAVIAEQAFGRHRLALFQHTFTFQHLTDFLKARGDVILVKADLSQSNYVGKLRTAFLHNRNRFWKTETALE